MQGHPTRRQVICAGQWRQRTEGELCAAAGAGRTRAAEGNNRQENFSPLKSDGPHFSFREKSWRADPFFQDLARGCCFVPL